MNFKTAWSIQSRAILDEFNAQGIHDFVQKLFFYNLKRQTSKTLLLYYYS